MSSTELQPDPALNNPSFLIEFLGSDYGQALAKVVGLHGEMISEVIVRRIASDPGDPLLYIITGKNSQDSRIPLLTVMYITERRVVLCRKFWSQIDGHPQLGFRVYNYDVNNPTLPLAHFAQNDGDLTPAVPLVDGLPKRLENLVYEHNTPIFNPDLETI